MIFIFNSSAEVVRSNLFSIMMNFPFFFTPVNHSPPIAANRISVSKCRNGHLTAHAKQCSVMRFSVILHSLYKRINCKSGHAAVKFCESSGNKHLSIIPMIKLLNFLHCREVNPCAISKKYLNSSYRQVDAIMLDCSSIEILLIYCRLKSETRHFIH